MDTCSSRKGSYQLCSAAALWLVCWVVILGTCKGDVLDCPGYCTCGMKSGLRRVQCINKGIINVDIGAPSRLQWLQLSYNAINSLEDKIFQKLGLTKMVALDMDHNSIHYMGLDTFRGLKYLERVDLSYNHLRHLQTAVFERNPSLKSLNLTGNPLKFIDGTTPFLSSKSLQVLDISRCGLPDLPWTSFGLLPAMKTLNVSYNQVLTLDREVFTVAKGLTTVDITGNPLICDSHIYKVDNSLKSQSIKLEGSPCQGVPGSGPTGQPKMMDKLVVENIGVDFQEYYDSTEDYDAYKEEYEEEQQKEKDKDNNNNNKGCSCERIVQQVEVNHQKGRMNVPMMMCLAGLAGVAAGIFLVTAVVLIKRMVEANRQRNRRRRWNNMTVTLPNGTPPPAYNELVFSFTNLDAVQLHH